MAVASLYRRRLPSPPAIDFSSSEGKVLFSEALQNGTMEGFFKLISYFQTQSEPAFCGLASLSVVLNALAIDPGRKWKGPWRWYDESMLDCCEPLEKIKSEGITFGGVACLAHCAGAEVQAFHANKSSIDDFRNHVVKCTSSADCHLIASYHRKLFKQTGAGHFSPIGGYHAEKDMVLILDVARFKYPSHWVPLPLLWDAINTVDEATGCPRGFILVSRLQKAPSLLYTISCRHESWVSIFKYLTDDVPKLLMAEGLTNVSEVLSCVFIALPANASDFIKWFAEIRSQDGDEPIPSEEEKERLAVKEEILQQVRETKLLKLVMDWLSALSTCNLPPLSDKDSLSSITASVCCQGARLLAGCFGASSGLCCKETSIKFLKNNGDEPLTVVSGKVLTGTCEQEVEVLVPVSAPKSCRSCAPDSSNCIISHPAASDVLTVLLLALPPQTWLGIKDKDLQKEVCSLVSTDNLPCMLQEEVLHLRKQMGFLAICKGPRDR